jgi:orotate phosphoribosyltransferase
LRPDGACVAGCLKRQYRRLHMNRNDLAISIVRAAHLTGQFHLRSGATSTEYFDKYRFESDPRLLRAIAQALAPLVPPGTEVLAGLELGGIPIAAALSLETGLPAAFVRKEAKSYGTCRLAEGIEITGRRLLVVEDVITSGGQVVKSTEQLRALGALVPSALCVIDRQAGSADTLATAQVTLSALFTKSQLEAAG